KLDFQALRQLDECRKRRSDLAELQSRNSGLLHIQLLGKLLLGQACQRTVLKNLDRHGTRKRRPLPLAPKERICPEIIGYEGSMAFEIGQPNLFSYASCLSTHPTIILISRSRVALRVCYEAQSTAIRYKRCIRIAE